MNFYQLFYIMSVGDKISILLIWFAVFSTIFTVIVIASRGFASTETEKSQWGKRKVFNWFTFSFLLWLGYVLIPSRKDAIMIVAGGSIGEFMTTDTTAKQIPHDVMVFVSSELKKAAAEAKVEITGLTEKKLEDLSKEELIEKLKQK